MNASRVKETKPACNAEVDPSSSNTECCNANAVFVSQVYFSVNLSTWFTPRIYSDIFNAMVANDILFHGLMKI